MLFERKSLLSTKHSFFCKSFSRRWEKDVYNRSPLIRMYLRLITDRRYAADVRSNLNPFLYPPDPSFSRGISASAISASELFRRRMNLRVVTIRKLTLSLNRNFLESIDGNGMNRMRMLMLNHLRCLYTPSPPSNNDNSIIEPAPWIPYLLRLWSKSKGLYVRSRSKGPFAFIRKSQRCNVQRSTPMIPFLILL
jgi:hypothetical protein